MFFRQKSHFADVKHQTLTDFIPVGWIFSEQIIFFLFSYVYPLNGSRVWPVMSGCDCEAPRALIRPGLHSFLRTFLYPYGPAHGSHIDICCLIFY